MPLKVVFLGSKPIGYHCLQYLLTQRKIYDIEVIGIKSKMRKEFGDEFDLLSLAEEHDVPLIEHLDELPECDIIYSVQHHELLKSNHIAKAQQIAVNLHLAPLPEYRGCNQFSFAIWEQAKEFGVTIHEMNTRIDDGDILFQERFAIPENCWVEELMDLSVEVGIRLFKSSLNDLVHGNYQKTPQQQLLGKYPTSLHYRDEIEQLKQIDLSGTKADVERQIRATFMPGFEPPFFFIGDEKVYFQK